MGNVEFTKDEVIQAILEKSLATLGNGEIYLSEDDFKFSFAQAAKEVGCKDIILEYPIMTAELYGNDERFREAFDTGTGRSKIDVSFKHANTQYFIELKYKLAEVSVERYGQQFRLLNQGAQNNGLYATYEDIERMENIRNCRPQCKSFVVMITNDNAYWNVHNGAIDRAVSLVQPDNTDVVHTLNGDIRYQNAGRDWRTLHIRNEYYGSFELFKEINGSEFKVLVLDLND